MDVVIVVAVIVSVVVIVVNCVVVTVVEANEDSIACVDEVDDGNIGGPSVNLEDLDIRYEVEIEVDVEDDEDAGKVEDADEVSGVEL